MTAPEPVSENITIGGEDLGTRDPWEAITALAAGRDELREQLTSARTLLAEVLGSFLPTGNGMVARVKDELHAKWTARATLSGTREHAARTEPERPAVQIAPCPVEGHDADHFQVSTGAAWLCGELLAQMLTAQGTIPDPAAVTYFAETWQELMTGMPDDYRCTYTCGEANAAADLYRALGDDETAKAVIAAHAAYDEEGDQHYGRESAGTEG